MYISKNWIMNVKKCANTFLANLSAGFDLAFKWHVSKQNSTWNDYFMKFSGSCCWCNFWRSVTCDFDRCDVTIKSMHIKKLRIFGLFLSQMGPNGKTRLCSQNRIATSAPLQIKIWDKVYISKNWNIEVHRNFQPEKYFRRCSSFSPIWRVK